MPPQSALAAAAAHKTPKVRRRHSGCKTCRKRGKRCDETKPTCRACLRLDLECGYTVDYSFRNHDARSFRPRVETPKPSPASTESSDYDALVMVNSTKPCSPSSLDCGSNLEATYWSHFHHHVRHLLPGIPAEFLQGATQFPALRFAALCISASNLSMLNTQVQNRTITKDYRRSVASPLVNSLHHFQAQEYHKHALIHSKNHVKALSNPAMDLISRVLLAYYHHASTDHLQFRLSVWNSVQFVIMHRDALLRTVEGTAALQTWYRLCISHRLSKPPAFMLEGEGPSAFGPNRFPDTFDQLFLSCIMNMNTDDLIYDILIKTIEIRSRLVVFRCVAGTHQIFENSRDIGPVSYAVLNKLLGRNPTAFEQAEAEQGFVRDQNLVGLLEVQKQRLQVWRSKTATDQLKLLCDSEPKTRFPRHRDSMNALYSILCEMMFQETNRSVEVHATQPGAEASSSILSSLAENMCSLAATLDFRTSSTDDIYAFSLAEVLLQMVLVWRSEPIVNYILDVIWPQMESKSRGYEHSHYPTHLIKRIIHEISRYAAQGRAVTFTQLAVPEDMPKVKLLDIDYPIHLVVGGYGGHGEHFLERIPLP